jgi:hypothetical protein
MRVSDRPRGDGEPVEQFMGVLFRFGHDCTCSLVTWLGGACQWERAGGRPHPTHTYAASVLSRRGRSARALRD